MAAYTSQPTRSRRFIKVYLTGWAFAAVGALGYLAVLAFQPSGQPPPRVQAADADPGQAMRALAKTAVEMGTMRRNLADVQKDVSDLKDAAVEGAAKEKTVASRLTAVEERLASMDAESAAPKSKANDKAKGKTAAEQRPTARLINVAPGEPAPPAAKADGPPVPLETGSIAPPNEEITFGAPVVTPATPTTFGVQLAAHPSLEGLRERWDRLREVHNGQLGALEPRIVPPRTGGGAYRLLAGPFATKAEADRACADMGINRPGCFATPYVGAPL